MYINSNISGKCSYIIHPTPPTSAPPTFVQEGEGEGDSVDLHGREEGTSRGPQGPGHQVQPGTEAQLCQRIQAVLRHCTGLRDGGRGEGGREGH